MDIYKHPSVIQDILGLFQKRQRGVSYSPYLTGFEPEKYSSGLKIYEKDKEYFLTTKEIENEIDIYNILENLCFGEDLEKTNKFLKELKFFLVKFLSEDKEFSLPFMFAFYPELKDRKNNLFYYCLRKKDKEQIEKDKKFLERLNYEGLEDRIALFKKYYYHFH